MVFGTTYCAISHLPIEDGDKCILIPLGFNMKYSFDQWNKADVNSFMYLYSFIHEPQEVIYNGNPDDIEYLDKTYEQTLKHELYMLVHLEFYNSIQKEFMNECEAFESAERLPNFKTCGDIWRKAMKIKNEKQNETRIKWVEKKAKGEKFTDEQALDFMTTPIPEWIKAIYKVAMFIDGMGMIPYPNNAVDQHQKNELYEKLRSDCIKKQNEPNIDLKVDDKTKLTFDKDSGELIKVKS